MQGHLEELKRGGRPMTKTEIKLNNLNKGIDELIEKYKTKYDYDNSEYSLPSADYFCFIQGLKKLKGE